MTAGDGDTAANLDALVAEGADVIELGMPFTDPMADGPPVEPSHAIAAVAKVAPTMGEDQMILMNLCGRGDKDIFTVAEELGVEI